MRIVLIAVLHVVDARFAIGLPCKPAAAAPDAGKHLDLDHVA